MSFSRVLDEFSHRRGVDARECIKSDDWRYPLHLYMIRELMAATLSGVEMMNGDVRDLGDVIVYTGHGFKFRSTVLALDLDSTVIHTRSGNVFPKNDQDWMIPGSVIATLRNAANSESPPSIIIVTNQSKLKDTNQIAGYLDKIDAIVGKLALGGGGGGCMVLIAVGSTIYRKPNTFIFDEFVYNHREVKRLTFVGDAAGRTVSATRPKKDFSASDRQFALNIATKYPAMKTTFMTPEQYFDEVAVEEPYELFTGVDIREIIAQAPTKYPFKGLKPGDEEREMVLTVGYPGGGKSVFAEWLVSRYKYRRFSKDITPNKPALKRAVSRAITERQNIVIDNTHPTIASRAEFVELLGPGGGGYRVRYVVFTAGLEVCMHLNQVRAKYAHTHGENVPLVSDVVYYTFCKAFEQPVESDFESVEEMPFVNTRTSDEEYMRMLYEY
jgi:bifunctional polynucleotide phosphatase/kinase